MSDERQPLGGVGQTVIGNQAGRARAADQFVALADAEDARKIALYARVAPVVASAELLQKSDARLLAASLFDWLATQFRIGCFNASADHYESRARECRRRRRTGK